MRDEKGALLVIKGEKINVGENDMKMKMLGLMTAVTALSMSVFAGGKPICDEIPTQVDLIAGQHYDAGDVIIASNDEFLFVTFILENGWLLYESHVAVGDTVADIPQTKKGCPKNGNFAFGDTHAGDDMYVVAIPLNSFAHDETIIVAAHAVVAQGSGSSYWEETAWGEGSEFECRNWAMYIEHNISPCVEEPPRRRTVFTEAAAEVVEPVEAATTHPGKGKGLSKKR
jgi:hypothetical protein